MAVRAGVGLPNAGAWGDQFSDADDHGALLDGGFTWGCSENLGNRVTSTGAPPFGVVCMSDGTPEPGLNWMTEGQATHLAFEESWDGYVAGALGSIVGVADGSYLVVWASRGDGGPVDGGTGAHARAQDAPDVAMVHVNADGTVRGRTAWLTDTPEVSESGCTSRPMVRIQQIGTSLCGPRRTGCQYLTGTATGLAAPLHA